MMCKERKPRMQDVKAEDYATPEKYLDGAEIPTFYQFQSNLVADEDLKPGMVRQLEVDKRLTLPTRTHIRFLVTGQDVLHNFSVPALGVKTDATPGRLNRINTFIQREGFVYGLFAMAQGGKQSLNPHSRHLSCQIMRVADL